MVWPRARRCRPCGASRTYEPQASSKASRSPLSIREPVQAPRRRHTPLVWRSCGGRDSVGRRHWRGACFASSGSSRAARAGRPMWPPADRADRPIPGPLYRLAGFFGAPSTTINRRRARSECASAFDDVPHVVAAARESIERGNGLVAMKLSQGILVCALFGRSRPLHPALARHSLGGGVFQRGRFVQRSARQSRRNSARQCRVGSASSSRAFQSHPFRHGGGASTRSSQRSSGRLRVLLEPPRHLAAAARQSVCPWPCRLPWRCGSARLRRCAHWPPPA